MYRETIGIIGGFGAYATLGFYSDILKAFASDSERNYPHIYMDNDFTMPSRTRALLYGEAYDDVVKMIADSMLKMDALGADYIVMACGTAHAFLPDVYKIVGGGVKAKVVDIIEVLKKRIEDEKITRVLIIAAEGTLKRGVYGKYLKSTECIEPSSEYYNEIRYFIESVKQNKRNTEVYQRCMDFLEQFDCENVVLGCTEFPILFHSIKETGLLPETDKYRFWNPLELTIEELKKKMK